MAIPEPTANIYYLVTRAARVMTLGLRQELALAGVWDARPAYIGVLLSLADRDGLKTGEVGRRAGLEPSSMTGLLDRMGRDGFLLRRPDPDDRRAQRIHLTDAGRRVIEPALAAVDSMLVALLEGIPADDLETVKRTLHAILANAVRSEAS